MVNFDKVLLRSNENFISNFSQLVTLQVRYGKEKISLFCFSKKREKWEKRNWNFQTIYIHSQERQLRDIISTP